MIIVLLHVFYLLGKLVYKRYNRNNNSLGSGHAEDDKPTNIDINSTFDLDSEDDIDGLDADDDDYIDFVTTQSKDMRNRTNLLRRDSTDDLHDENRVNIRFSPPAFIQRYQAVSNILSDPKYTGKLKKVVDFGCSELGFCLYIKKLPSVEEGLFVDVDREVLDLYKEKTRPLHVDYLHRRASPLVLKVFEGSVTQHDKSLENCDAVICIELVEHLYPEPLTTLPFNIFGFIKPKVAIITTPNADFNVLFQNMSGFRHPDHKFEWTRAQFEDWAHNIVARFPEYTVTFHGICNGPPGTEHLGACSQMAVFHKSFDLECLEVEKVTSIPDLYNLVSMYEYPFQVDNRTDEQKILDEAIYNIRKFSNNDLDITEEIPLQRLLDVMRSFCISINDLKEVLQNANWGVEDREEGPVVLVPPPSTFSNQSIIDDDFLDNEYPPGYYDWDEPDPGPSADYQYCNAVEINDINLVDEEDWENEPSVVIPWVEPADQDTEATNNNVDQANSTPSIYPDDVCLDDIETESRSAELANSAVDESIVISNFSETKVSDDSDTAKNSYPQTQDSEISIDNKIADISTFYSCQSANETKLPNRVADSIDVSSSKNISLCSMYLEPSKMSNDINLEDLTKPDLDSNITSPCLNKTNKKMKLNLSLSNMHECTFEEPKYTSSPHISLSSACKKRKLAKQRDESSILDSASNSNKDLILGINDISKDVLIEHDSKSNDPSMCSNESVIAESNLSSYSPQTNNSDSPERVRHYTGAIPKNFNHNIFDTKVNTHIETKLERISPDIPESPPNSWSPEIMDSGYPNSNSPPDLSPEYDLSSIAQDQTLDSESPSIADVPRFGFFDVAEVENRDLANNNLDDEGNNMEAEENQHINDLRPLINVLENDLENENDIYVVRNGFPIWLLRILQRFNADGGVGINLPMLQPPNENYGE